MKQKIAILGGGIAALSAAFELTEHDPDGELFDITVYTLGWRLGGKGAVGRRNASFGYRAEEHGLHVWTGFYDNAFELVDRCYEALRRLGKTPPFGGSEQAFEGLDHFTVMEPRGAGKWDEWLLTLSNHAGRPGAGDGSFLSLTDYVKQLVEVSSRQLADPRLAPTQWYHAAPAPAWLSGRQASQGPFALAKIQAASLPSDARRLGTSDVPQLKCLLNASLAILRHRSPLCGSGSHYAAFHSDDIHNLILAEIALTIAVGMLSEDVLVLGFDCIDDWEWSAWMRSHGCSETSLNSALVRGCYDYVFGYFDGKINIAAGTATRILLKLALGYKGSFFYVLRATMGELIFAPLYQVLRKRNVSFNFFSKVDRLHLSPDGRSIDSILIGIQATACNPPYEPLILDRGGDELPSWPSQPRYELLQQGCELRRLGVDLESAWTDWKDVGSQLLKRGDNFDAVVLGIPIGAHPQICAELIERWQAWKEMVDAVKTTPTVALQIWTTDYLSTLRVKDKETLLSGFAKPFDSWGDLSLQLSLERWGSTPPPRGLGYFVGSFNELGAIPAPGTPDPAFPAGQLANAAQDALGWISANLSVLWPGVVDAAGQLRWEVFFDPQNRIGPERFEAQYLRVNINPSDRYVLSVVNSVYKRMRAGESGIDNLFLAGDWVRTGINAGCIEAAVMAGRAAAGAIMGVNIAMPNSSDFAGFDVPMAVIPALDALRKVGKHAVGGVGDVEAYCVIVPMPIDFVRSKLPPGLALPKGKDETEHDVVFIFSYQRNVRPGPLLFGGIKYVEIAEQIPDVVHTDTPGLEGKPFAFTPYFLLTQMAPVILGQNLYGFNKQLAQIRAEGGSFDMRSAVGPLSAWLKRTGMPGDIAQFPDIAAIRSKMEQPLVGVRPDGTFIYSIMNFNLDTASFQLVDGQIRVGHPFAADAGTLNVSSQAATAPWAFHFTTHWALSFAFDFPAPKGEASAFNVRSLAANYMQSVFGKFPMRR